MTQNTIAIVYDFDGTLSPSNMQEYTVFPQLEIEPKDFWGEVHKLNQKQKGDEIITYMMLMLRKAQEKRVRIKKQDLRESAKKIKYFQGVKYWFDRINKLVLEESGRRVKVKHYLLSSGLKEILDGIPIKHHFHKIFASEYVYDEYGKPQNPKVVITDTIKTQYLFRINKGKEDILTPINEYMPEVIRPVPFQNIIYIGDGLTDVPCMTVATKNGGTAIAVFPPGNEEKQELCSELFKCGRVAFISPADYRVNKSLDKYMKQLLKNIIESIKYKNLQHELINNYIIKSNEQEEQQASK